jgi:hypothetical protein
LTVGAFEGSFQSEQKGLTAQRKTHNSADGKRLTVQEKQLHSISSKGEP